MRSDRYEHDVDACIVLENGKSIVLNNEGLRLCDQSPPCSTVSPLSLVQTSARRLYWLLCDILSHF